MSAKAASLAPARPGAAPNTATEARSREEALGFKMMDQSLESDRLEAMECQVASDEEALASREARI